MSDFLKLARLLLNLLRKSNRCFTYAEHATDEYYLGQHCAYRWETRVRFEGLGSCYTASKHSLARPSLDQSHGARCIGDLS